jgi:NAD(P)-dependent dehydrogenase (short-subunit alcohol dehydrogenase family)
MTTTTQRIATTSPRPLSDLFDLTGRVAVLTGGSGLLGQQHASVLREAGARVFNLDLAAPAGEDDLPVDITDAASVQGALQTVLARAGRCDIVINNAANNPRVEDGMKGWSRFENLDVAAWDADLAVGLTGAFLVSQVFGTHLARSGGGVIVNVCSELGVIAPDQRLYRLPGVPDDEQPVKTVTYSVVKAGLIGMTRYLATYWADAGVRVNAISPGGVFNDQPAEFVAKLSSQVPLGRMARPDEMRGALAFLCSDASSYLNGHNLIVDGGRTVW